MTTLQRLLHWKQAGAITAVQYDAISAMVRKDRFSVFFELNALLYLGVLSFIGGVGWVIQVYAASLGDIAIISGLTLVLLASFYYCFSRAIPYSPGEAESPTLAFDYVLYLACLTFGIAIGYVETRFHLMHNDWDFYLLISAALFLGLAYRFDNRLVLSLALSTLAGWFGLKMSRFDLFIGDSLRLPALTYGMTVIGAGAWLGYRNIKRHFTETYFHVGAIVLFIALLSGVSEHGIYLLAAVGLAAIAVFGGIRFRQFAFVVYGVLFGYIGISMQLLRGPRLDSSAVLAYFVVSGSVVIVAVVLLARRFGRQQ